jgi:hypothetical protein
LLSGIDKAASINNYNVSIVLGIGNVVTIDFQLRKNTLRIHRVFWTPQAYETNFTAAIVLAGCDEIARGLWINRTGVI